ncbi:hypothetical protein [uncultured Clostridium sp.]|uniref:hypothetical protein n=1 Tax=uncultured Clostridium sp. TaxID=59620 RepID=UPI00261FA2EA|nr:hypothetical protein [uncultured Clostridium sp.]
MKSISIVLIIASFLMIVMGIFLMAMSKRYSGSNGKISKVNGISQIVLGIYGTTLGIIYQFASMSKNLMLILFIIGIVGINIVQITYKRKIQKSS